MADGKLNIKGTITIKTSKSKKKKRKPRKKKTGLADTGGYTGTGKAETREEFASPYTAQALMTAMALRSPPPQVTYMEQPQQKASLEQSYKFQELLDNPNIPFDVPVITTKKELLLKAEPFLKKEIQQNVQQYRQSLEEDTRAYEERTMEAERQLEEQTLAMRQELEQRQQFFENELEQSTDYYNSELARMALTLSRGKAQSQLSLIGEKAKARQEIEQTRNKAQVEAINELSIATLKTKLKKESPDFNVENIPIEQLRLELARVRQIPVKLQPPEKVRGRPTSKLQYNEQQGMLKRVPQAKEATEQVLEPAQPSANDLLMKKMRENLRQAQEDQLTLEWLAFSTRKQQLEKKLELLPRETSLSRTLPNYVKTPFGMMTEERAKQELGSMSLSKMQQAEALDLAQNIQPRIKKQDYTV